MKILFVSTTYPTPRRPRQGAFNRTLVDALSVQNELRVIAPMPWTVARRAINNGNELHPIYYYPPKVFRSQYHRFYGWSIQSSVKQVVRQFTPDIVLAYWLHPDGAAAIGVARQLNVPAVVISGGSDLRLLTEQPARRRAIANTCRQADRLIVLSQELAVCAQQLGMPAAGLDVILRGVDQTCFRPMDRADARQRFGLDGASRVVGWAGRFEAVKDPLLLLQAARAWRARYGDGIRVLMAGSGPLRGSLERARREFGLNETVTFLGNVTQGELASLFNAADLTVLTSSSEGTPNVLLESIRCGTRFVATDVGGVSAIASRGVDRLVPAGDCDALVAAVVASLECPSEGKRDFYPSDTQEMGYAFECSLRRALQQSSTTQPLIATARMGVEVTG